MEDDFKKIFLNFKDQDIPEFFYRAIFSRIQARKILLAKIRLAVFGSSLLFSLIAIVPVLKYLSAEFYESGFYSYLSLIFSDSSVVFQNWKEIILSLAESAPILGIAIFLAVIFILLSSLKVSTENAKTVFFQTNFA